MKNQKDHNNLLKSYRTMSHLKERLIFENLDEINGAPAQCSTQIN